MLAFIYLVIYRVNKTISYLKGIALVWLMCLRISPPQRTKRKKKKMKQMWALQSNLSLKALQNRRLSYKYIKHDRVHILMLMMKWILECSLSSWGHTNCTQNKIRMILIRCLPLTGQHQQLGKAEQVSFDIILQILRSMLRFLSNYKIMVLSPKVVMSCISSPFEVCPITLHLRAQSFTSSLYSF